MSTRTGGTSLRTFMRATGIFLRNFCNDTAALSLSGCSVGCNNDKMYNIALCRIGICSQTPIIADMIVGYTTSNIGRNTNNPYGFTVRCRKRCINR